MRRYCGHLTTLENNCRGYWIIKSHMEDVQFDSCSRWHWLFQRYGLKTYCIYWFWENVSLNGQKNVYERHQMKSQPYFLFQYVMICLSALAGWNILTFTCIWKHCSIWFSGLCRGFYPRSYRWFYRENVFCNLEYGRKANEKLLWKCMNPDNELSGFRNGLTIMSTKQ